MKHRLILGLLFGLLSSAGALSGGGSHDPDVPRLKASLKAKIEKALQRAAHHLDQAVDEVETPIDASLLESETLRLVKDFENEVDKFSDSDSEEQEHPEPRRKLKTDETDALTEVPFVIQPTDADPVLNDESPLVTPTVEYEEKRFDMDLTRKPKVPIVVDEAATKVPEVAPSAVPTTVLTSGGAASVAGIETTVQEVESSAAPAVVTKENIATAAPSSAAPAVVVTKEDIQTVASTVVAQEIRSSAPPVVAVTTGDGVTIPPSSAAPEATRTYPVISTGQPLPDTRSPTVGPSSAAPETTRTYPVIWTGVPRPDTRPPGVASTADTSETTRTYPVIWTGVPRPDTRPPMLESSSAAPETTRTYPVIWTGEPLPDTRPPEVASSSAAPETTRTYPVIWTGLPLPDTRPPIRPSIDTTDGGNQSSSAPTVATSGGISTAVPTVAEVVSSPAPAFEVTKGDVPTVAPRVMAVDTTAQEVQPTAVPKLVVTQGEASTAMPTVPLTAAPTIATTAAPIVFENIASGVVVTYVPTAVPAQLSRLGPVGFVGDFGGGKSGDEVVQLRTVPPLGSSGPVGGARRLADGEGSEKGAGAPIERHQKNLQPDVAAVKAEVEPTGFLPVAMTQGPYVGTRGLKEAGVDVGGELVFKAKAEPTGFLPVAITQGPYEGTRGLKEAKPDEEVEPTGFLPVAITQGPYQGTRGLKEAKPDKNVDAEPTGFLPVAITQGAYVGTRGLKEAKPDEEVEPTGFLLVDITQGPYAGTRGLKEARPDEDVEEDLEPTQDEETQDFKFRNDIFDDMDGVEDGQEEHDQKERLDPHPARLAPRDQWLVDELFDGKTPKPPTLDHMWRPTESTDVSIDPKPFNDIYGPKAEPTDVTIDPNSFDNIHWRHPVPTKFPQPIIGPGACKYIHCPNVEPTEVYVDEGLRNNIPDDEDDDTEKITQRPVPTKFPQPIIGPGACNHINCPKVEPTEDWVDEKLRKNIPDNENVDVGINPLPDRHPKGGNAHGIEGMLESLEAKERAEKLSHKDNDERDGFWMWVQGGTLKNKNHGHNDHVKTSGDHFRMKLLDISAEINTSGEEKPKLDILAKLLDEISAEQ